MCLTIIFDSDNLILGNLLALLVVPDMVLFLFLYFNKGGKRMIYKNKRKIIVGLVLIVVAIFFFIKAYPENEMLKLKKSNLSVEYGQSVSSDLRDYLNFNGLTDNEIKNIIKETKYKSNVINEVETINNEDGTTTEKDKGYAKVGDYKITLIYKNEIKTIKVKVRDTIAPELIIPENIEIMQGTDLATFDFKSLIIATDLARLNDVLIDYSTIDINNPGEYIAKVSVEDVNKNKVEKEFKVKVVNNTLENEIVTDSMVERKKNAEITTPETKNSSGDKSNSNVDVSSKPVGGNSSFGNTSNDSNVETSIDNETGENISTHIHEWYAICACGYKVTSNISWQDAVFKLESAGHNSFEPGHSSYEAGGCH